VVTATGNISGGNVATAGNVTANNVLATTLISSVDISASNLITTADFTASGQANLGNIVIDGNDVTGTDGVVTFNAAGDDVDFVFSGDTNQSVLVVDAGSDTVIVGGNIPTVGATLKIASTDSLLLPVGNTAQRPGTPDIGMFRFNTSEDVVEIYTSTGWLTVGSEISAIVSDQFTGNGVQTVFTLSAASTTAATIVSINGVVQIPVTAYAVSGTTLTFTEAPESTDEIDIRIITSLLTSITGLTNAPANASISGNATASQFDITGNLIPAADATYNLGSLGNRWADLFVSGNSIHLGDVVIKNTTGNIIGFFGPDGTTPGSIDTNNIDSAGISNGTSNVSVVGTSGNVNINIDGNLITAFSSAGIDAQNKTIANIATPVNPQDAANKQYVDEVAEGLRTRPAVEIATTGNLIATYNNGASGVGSTLTATTNGAFPEIDGVTLTSTTLGQNGVLVKNQTNAAQNGRYNLTQVGDGSNPWILTRCSLCDESDEVPGSYTFVKRGTLYAGTGWVQTVTDPSTFVIGTDPIFVVQFSGAGVITAGAGLTLNENVLSITVTEPINVIGITNAGANGVGNIGNVANAFGTVFSQNVFVGNVLLKESAGNLRVRNFDDSADAVVEATFVATSSTAGNIQIGDNHIESTNVNGEINLRPNGIGNVELESATIRVGKQNANVVVTSFGTGNLVFAVNASNVIAVTADGIENGLANGVGNIGSATNTFNTVFAKATSAQYADLAEMYAADAAYAPGTVVSFGGAHEVTISSVESDTRIAGVVSTNPSYLMNSTQTGEHVVAVALTGRVPTQVVGPVRKGDMMVSAGNGHACASSNPAMGTVIGKSLEDFDGVQGTIEIVVGRL
jgi:hypothetical protein